MARAAEPILPGGGRPEHRVAARGGIRVVALDRLHEGVFGKARAAGEFGNGLH